MTQRKSRKIDFPIKVRVQWVDESFDFVELVDRVLDFKAKLDAGILGEQANKIIKEKIPELKMIEISEYK